MKNYWVGLQLKILAENEKDAGLTAEDIATELKTNDPCVVEAFWDAFTPEEEEG